MVSSPAFRPRGGMVKCVRRIAREAAAHGPTALVWTRLKQSGRRCSSGLNEQPDANAKDLFHRLRESMPGAFAPGQLRTLQRRVKQWRSEIARQLVFGFEPEAQMDGNMAVSAVAA